MPAALDSTRCRSILREVLQPDSTSYHQRIVFQQAPRPARHRHPDGHAAPATVPLLASHLKTSEKIALFRSLFRGREDVYARRWESPDGRTGYSPNTERDWTAYYAAKPEDRKRVDKETKKNIPLDDEAIHNHLAGKHTIGVYPLLLDETCWFLAVDFDKKTWKQDAAAFRDTCNALGVPALVECSRSGNGAHVWIFFERPVPAVLARRLGSLLLTKTMERRQPATHRQACARVMSMGIAAWALFYGYSPWRKATLRSARNAIRGDLYARYVVRLVVSWANNV
ncbi:MAG: hypothetical protein J0L64_14285 [Acidobacteria bacterium]|nr:hypothetical protein [Acidobacteriota bacterium]